MRVQEALLRPLLIRFYSTTNVMVRSRSLKSGEIAFRRFVSSKALLKNALHALERTWVQMQPWTAKKRLDTTFENLCQFMMIHVQGMLHNGLRYRLLDKFVLKWSPLGLCLVAHPAQRTLLFLFAYLPDNVLCVLEIRRRPLPKPSTVVLHDDGKALPEEVHIELSKNDVSVLFKMQAGEARARKWAAFWTCKAPEDCFTNKTS